MLRQIVEDSMAAGARLAEPGEFTLRAFLNGRLDLIQAEAVADLIDAVTRCRRGRHSTNLKDAHRPDRRN